MYKTPVDNWHMMGGIEHPEEDRVVDQEDDRSYFYQKWYNLFINHEGFLIVEKLTSPNQVLLVRRTGAHREDCCIYLFVELWSLVIAN